MIHSSNKSQEEEVAYSNFVVLFNYFRKYDWTEATLGFVTRYTSTDMMVYVEVDIGNQKFTIGNTDIYDMKKTTINDAYIENVIKKYIRRCKLKKLEIK